MGEIADSLIDGEFDYISGEYIGPGVGYPRTHHNSTRTKNPEHRKHNSSYRGLENILCNQGMRNVECRSRKAIIYIIKEFANTKDIDITQTIEVVSDEVQKHYKEFKEWYRNSEHYKLKHSYPQ